MVFFKDAAEQVAAADAGRIPVFRASTALQRPALLSFIVRRRGFRVDEAAARAMVAEFLATLPTRGKDRWVTSRVEDYGDFWLVCWTTSRALPPRNLEVHMTGNYPVGVRKSDGLARFWTLLFPLEEFAERLRARPETLPPFPEAWVASDPDQ